MHHDIRHSIRGAVISGIIGSAILSAILYIVDKKINWFLMVGWFVVFTVIIGFFYKYYFLHGGKVLEKKTFPLGKKNWNKRKKKKKFAGF